MKKINKKKRPPAKRVHLDPLGPRQGATKRRVFDALALKRRNPEWPITKAARQAGTTLATIRRYAGGVLETRSGRLDVKPRDRLMRSVRMLTDRGEIIIDTSSSVTASRIARHSNAIRAYRITNDPGVLAPFQSKFVRSGGQRYEFVTDPRTIDRLFRAGAVNFLDLYATWSDQ